MFDFCVSAKATALVHVSTAYVNANIADGSVIREELYPLPFDAADFCRRPQKYKNFRNFGYPNTYTLSKSVAEAMLFQRFKSSKELRLSIVRPSIIGAAYQTPCPGWVDVVNAAGAVFLAGALGVLTIIRGNPRGVADIVPVDFVVDDIIEELLLIDSDKKFSVRHSCTSTSDPTRWRVAIGAVQDHFQSQPPKAKLTPGLPHFRMIRNKKQFNAEWYARYTLPAKLGILPEILDKKGNKMCELFTPFTETEYFFDSAKGEILRSTGKNTFATLRTASAASFCTRT